MFAHRSRVGVSSCGSWEKRIPKSGSSRDQALSHLRSRNIQAWAELYKCVSKRVMDFLQYGVTDASSMHPSNFWHTGVNVYTNPDGAISGFPFY